MKERSTLGKVPIYNLSLELVVTDDIKKSQKKEPRFTRLGKQKPLSCAGICVYCQWNFCIIFDTRYLDHNLIAHEIFHVTHRMLDYCGKDFKVKNHEEFAYLHGFLSNFVYNQLKQWKIRIK